MIWYILQLAELIKSMDYSQYSHTPVKMKTSFTSPIKFAILFWTVIAVINVLKEKSKFSTLTRSSETLKALYVW